MSSGNEYERLFKLWATVAKLVVDGKRDAAEVAYSLQEIVDKHNSLIRSSLFTLLEKRLEEGGRIDLDPSLDDEEIKGWIAKPGTYPRGYRSKAVFLWESVRSPMGNGEVAYLVFINNVVSADWVRTRARLFRMYPHP